MARTALRVALALAAVVIPTAAASTPTRVPDTRILSAPVTVHGTSASVRFAARPNASGYDCRLDQARWASCRSPVRFSHLAPGTHRVAVRARDRLGRRDRSPAKAVIVVAAPTTPATPAAPTTTATAPAPATLPVDTAPAPVSLPAGILFRDGFEGSDGVITNHYAMWSGDKAAHRSPDYEVESGTLYRAGGTATTGVPTWDQPWSIDSTEGSGNDIFRDWTKRSDFGNVRVDMRFRFEAWSDGHDPDWPAKSWDGVKIWLRRQGASGSWGLYTAEIARRQGNVIIQKKCTGSDNYTLLAQTSATLPPVSGTWETDGGSVQTNADGSVTVSVIRDDKVVLTATDHGGNGCDPITTPGRVGVRGDNTQFSFDDFTVRDLLP